MVKCRNCQHYITQGPRKGWCTRVHRKIRDKDAYKDIPCNWYESRFIKKPELKVTW